MIPRGSWVYVAGPITKGNQFVNVRLAILAGEQLRKEGFVPLIPHLSALWELIGSEASYEDWMALDFAYISRCDALLRLAGDSPGADREVREAIRIGIPVVHSVVDLVNLSKHPIPDCCVCIECRPNNPFDAPEHRSI